MKLVRVYLWLADLFMALSELADVLNGWFMDWAEKRFKKTGGTPGSQAYYDIFLR